MTQTSIDSAIRALLGEFTPETNSSISSTIQKTLLIARTLQRRAAELQTPAERKQQMELDRMIQNPSDKVTMTALTDQAFRSDAAARSAEQLIHILDVQGIPRFFDPVERAMLRGFQSFGGYLPGVTIPLVKDKMRAETANVILPAEEEVLRKHLNARRDEAVRMNVNLLGEAILGEDEANHRLKTHLQAFQMPEIEVMSVKISTIYSQISPIARDHSIRQMCERMELLYRAAARGRFTRSDGTVVPKFVYLDMEEYRDLSLTAEVFMATLDRSGMEDVAAGIVFQAYIPDSFYWQKQVTEWAKKRVAAGGGPVTIRIVKGANMEMERVEASHHDWPQAPFKHKVETDANYKRMVQYAFQADNLVAVRPGIASHNLFDISYALVLATEMEALNGIQFEMLEGMANHQRRALHELTRNVLLYAPACRQQDFIHAIGYLVRRLDENTGDDNFLRHAFNIEVGSDAWKKLEAGFLQSFDLIEQLSDQPRRQQDRNTETFAVDPVVGDWKGFENAADTDFSLSQNAEWGDSIVLKWKELCGSNAVKVPLFVAGQQVTEGRKEKLTEDPSRDNVIVARYLQGNAEDAEAAMRCAKEDPSGWREKSSEERFQILKQVAVEVRQARGDLMGAAMADGGKTLPESDPEVSEAIDFIEFYVATTKYFEQLCDDHPAVTPSGRGVVVVVSPWNFPIAIPCGGIAAALAAGNTTILKPASNTVLVSQLLCDCFYKAGVPRTALQLLPCSGGSVGSKLVSHDDVDCVILTGGTDTALRMLNTKPSMNLLAETGGKNATIVTAMADRDQAIKHVIHSAFGHSGQKCSATSLLLLEREVYDDPDFKKSLVDAAKSMYAGSAWDTFNKLGPLSVPPTGDLLKGLKELEDGESWALLPKRLNDSKCIYTPGIKWGVTRGSYTHVTEFFGPLLAVMPFTSLGEAIEIVNESGYGLTSGLESLDDREQTEWLSGIKAGNLYVNRSTTGAIVLRQPFGGMGKSAFGPGIKAGGPNYVAQLMNFHEDRSVTDVRPDTVTEIQHPALHQLAQELARLTGKLAEDSPRLTQLIREFDTAAQEEFLQEHDHFKLIGQDNIRRYLPVPRLCIRIAFTDTWYDIVARIAAARSVGGRVFVSSPVNVHDELLQTLHDITEVWAADIEFIEEDDDAVIEAIYTGAITRLRYACPAAVPDAIRKAVIGRYVHIAETAVIPIGRIELLWYVQEQSVCIDYHRYGNLGARNAEQRAPVR
ncbi:MAG: proline dehydrogenase family protein [Fuerstiella sp.]